MRVGGHCGCTQQWFVHTLCVFIIIKPINQYLVIDVQGHCPAAGAGAAVHARLVTVPWVATIMGHHSHGQ